MWSEATLLDAVIAHFDARRPAHLLRQVEVEDRRIDAILLVGGKRVGIEAKTSRADFHNETNEKRRPTERASNGCVYLCPPGVIERADLPYGWGLWWATGPASIKVVQQPLWHGVHPFATDALANALTRRAAATERRVRAAERAEDPVAALVAVDDSVRALEASLAQARETVRRERARAQHAAEQVAAVLGDQVCAACDEPIAYARTGGWRHVDREQQRHCEADRAEAERQRRMEKFACEYGSIPAPPIVPASVSTDH